MDVGNFGHIVRAAFVVVVLLAPGAVFAQATWDGSDSIDWDDLNNWFGGTTPTDGPDINIDTVEANPPFSAVIDSSTTNTNLSSSFLYVGKSNGSDAGLIISDGGVLQSYRGYAGYNSGSTGTILVTGTGSQWAMSNDLYVGRAGNGELTISDGGLVSNAGVSQGLIGYSSTGAGSVTVTGAGSQWTLGQVFMGFSGAGDLTVSAGGVVDSGNGWLGYNAASSGTALITGTDSQWSILGDVLAGYNGTGELTVADGGEVDSGYGYLGYNATGYGTATVTGTGSLWAMLYDLSVGRSGTGDLTIEDGGTVGSQYGYVGNLAGSSGTALITGTDSLWSMSNNFYVGYRGVGEVTITDGGVVNNSTGVLGYYGTGLGTATVSGANSEWDMFNPLYVGYEGIGDLTVSDGGYVSSQHGYIGRYAGSSGTALVNGADSALSTSGSLYVGYSGTGELTVSDGGAVSGGGSAIIGTTADGAGTVTVTGAGSQWTMASGLNVGNSGEGTLTIADGAAVNTGGVGRIGSLVGSSGAATITGVDSQWVMSNNLYVGEAGTGELVIADSGFVSSLSGLMGWNSGSSGTALVTGAGSQWTNSGDLYVGNLGTGELTVADGGIVSSVIGYIGNQTTGSGTATVTGAGSQWTTSDRTYVGYRGDATLTIADGGVVDTGDVGVVGYYNTASGLVTVTGAGSQWMMASDLALAVEGTGELTIADGGEVIVNSGTGVAYLGANGVATGFGTINIGAASGDAAAAPGTLSASTVTFRDGTGTVVFNHTDETGSFEFAPDFVSLDGISILDHYAGYTRLTGDGSLFTGDTTVFGGTLSVDNILGGAVGVMDGGTLAGSGTLSGAVTVADGGILAPGNSIGTLNVGSVTQSTGSTYAVEVDDAGNSDLLNAAGTYTIESGVTLTVSPDNGTDDGSTYAASTQYTIVTAAGGVTGTFDTITEDFFFLEAMANYDANNVYLTLEQIFDFVEAAMTPNQMATAGGLDSLDDADPLKDAMLMILSEEEAQDAFGQLSGEIHPALRGALRGNDARAVQAATARVRGLNGPAEDDTDTGHALWATGYGNWMTADATTNTHELGNDVYGLVAGVDRGFGDHARLGLLGGYRRTRTSLSALSSDGDADSYTAGLYGGTDDGHFVLDFGALYSWHNVSTSRRITNPLTETLAADYDARSLQLFSEAGFRIGDNRITAIPFAGVAYGSVETDAFTEQGGVAALSSPTQTTSTTFTTVGVRPIFDLAPNLQARGMAGWRHALGDVEQDSTFSFAASDRFTVSGAPIAEDTFVGEFGFDMLAASGVSIGASYVGQYGDGVASNGFDLRFRTEF